MYLSFFLFKIYEQKFIPSRKRKPKELNTQISYCIVKCFHASVSLLSFLTHKKEVTNILTFITSQSQTISDKKLSYLVVKIVY